MLREWMKTNFSKGGHVGDWFLEGINLILTIFTAISHCENSYNSAQFNHEMIKVHKVSSGNYG